MKLRMRRSYLRKLGIPAWVAVATLAAGCLIIPMDYYQAGSRANVRRETSEKLRVGATSKEEMLLALGEPDFASEDGRRLGYAWTKVKAVWVIVGGSGGASGEIARSYVLEVSFDAGNHISRLRMLKQWGSEVTPARELDDAE